MPLPSPGDLVGRTYVNAWQLAGGARFEKTSKGLENILHKLGFPESDVIETPADARDVLALAGAYGPNAIHVCTLNDPFGRSSFLFPISVYREKPKKPGLLKRLQQNHPYIYKGLVAAATVFTMGLAALGGFGGMLKGSHDGGAAAEDPGWPEGKTASEAADESGIGPEDLEPFIRKLPPEYADNIHLSDNFVLIPEDVGYREPGNITAFDVYGNLTATFMSRDVNILSSFLFQTPSLFKDKLIYCSLDNETLSGDFATNTSRVLFDSCKGGGIFSGDNPNVISADNVFIVTATKPGDPPNKFDYYIFDSADNLLGVVPRLNGTTTKYNFLGWQGQNLLFEFWNAQNPPKNITFRAFDLNTKQLKDVIAPADMPSTTSLLYNPNRFYLDGSGGLMFAGHIENNLTLFKYDGTQVSKVSSMPSDSAALLWHLKNNMALISYFYLNNFTTYKTELVDIIAKRSLTEFDISGLLLDAHFDGKRVLMEKDENLTQYDVAANKTRVVEGNVTSYSLIDASTFAFKKRNETDDENTTYELLFVSGGRAIRITKDTDDFRLNRNILAWDNETGVYAMRTSDLLGLLNGTATPPPPEPEPPVQPELPKPRRLLVPTLLYDSRDTPFYHPTFPRTIKISEFSPHSQGLEDCFADTKSLPKNFGDDRFVTNNHEKFDQLAGSADSTKFWAGSCVPFFYRIADYTDFEVQEFFQYYVYQPGFGPLSDGLTREHVVGAEMVWVNKTTGEPFYFAVLNHASPLGQDIWIKKPIKNESELVAYPQWNTKALGLTKNPNPPFWSGGDGTTIGQGLHGQSKINAILLPLESIINSSDVYDGGRYKTNELFGIFNKTNFPAKVPWQIASRANEPEFIRESSQGVAYLSYYTIGGQPAEMSFKLNDYVSDKTHWNIASSATNGRVGYFTTNALIEPNVRLMVSEDGIYDIQGHIIGIGNDYYKNFTLRQIHMKSGESLEVKPVWNNQNESPVLGVEYSNNPADSKPIAFNVTPPITTEKFEQALSDARQEAAKPAPRPARPAVRVGEQPWLLYLLLGGGGAAAAIYSYFETRGARKN